MLQERSWGHLQCGVGPLDNAKASHRFATAAFFRKSGNPFAAETDRAATMATKRFELLLRRIQSGFATEQLTLKLKKKISGRRAIAPPRVTGRGKPSSLDRHSSRPASRGRSLDARSPRIPGSRSRRRSPGSQSHDTRGADERCDACGEPPEPRRSAPRPPRRAKAGPRAVLRRRTVPTEVRRS